MCIIMYKPVNMAFPEESILKSCWDNNPHMGGFMYTLDGEVHIKKGYKTWEAFLDALNRTRAMTGDDIPYVCHFRISTQGYDTSCCQPFPLSAKMKRLRKSHCTSSVGIAHNGIIDITSDGAKDYSDTMKFITDFMTNIIRSLDWYKDERNLKLIENLIVGSRLAILDKNGHCQLMGNGWVEDKGIYYSNSTYSYKKAVYSYGSGRQNVFWDDDYYDDCPSYYYDYGTKSWVKREKESKEVELATSLADSSPVTFDPWSDYMNPEEGQYEFHSDHVGVVCPYTMEDDDSYCCACSRQGNCKYMLAWTKTS